MAKKKATARRRRRTGYTAGPAPVRRRKMNGARRKTARRRRIGSATTGIQADVSTVLQMAVGALAAGAIMGVAEKVIPNYYVRAGGAIVLGIAVGKFMPKAKSVGLGMATAGTIGLAYNLLAKANVALPGGPGAINGGGNRTTISNERMKQLVAKMRQANARMGGAGGIDMTLNEADYMARTLNSGRGSGTMS